LSWKFQIAKTTPKTHKEQQGITTGQGRRKLFLRYVNSGWLILGVVTLIALPFFPEQRGQFIYLIATIFPTYLIVRFLSLSGRMKLAGMIFTIAVNFGFYGLFLVLVHDLGAEETFRTQATIWMLMGLAILFAGAFVDKWAAPILALVNTVLLTSTRLVLAPNADPRPSAMVFWWMMALTIWMYERTLQQALEQVWNELAERKKNNEELRKLSSAVEHSPASIVITNPEAAIEYVNPHFTELTGYSLEEVVGKNPRILQSGLTPADLYVQMWNTIKSGKEWRGEFRNKKKNGELYWEMASISPIMDKAGVITHYVAVNEDITERKQTEEKLRMLLDTTSEGIALNEIIYDARGEMVDYRILEVNRAFYDMADFSSADVIGNTATNLYHMPPEDIKAFWQEHRDRGDIQRTEYMSPLSGKMFLISTSPFVENKFVTSFFDITEMKQVEEALSESRARLAGIIDSAMDAIITVDSDQRIVLFNAAAEKMFGYSADEVMGQPIDRLIPTQFRNAHREHIHHFGKTGMTNRSMFHLNALSGMRSDDTEFPIEVSISQGDVNGRKIYSAIVRDITERQEAEEKIRQQLQQLNALRMIDMTISSNFDINIILSVVLQQTISQLGVSACAILLVNQHQQTIEYAASRGFQSAVTQHTKLRIGEGYAGRAVIERRMVHISNLMETGGKLATALHLANEEFVDYYGAPLMVKGEVKGVLEVYHRSLLNPDSDWQEFLEILAGQAAIAIDNAQLFSSLQHSNLELELAYTAAIEGWSKAMDLRDKEAEGHTLRVTELTLKLARIMNISDSQLAHIRRGALLHDMGKLGVPDSILLKPGELTNEEWKVMRKHPQLAHEMLIGIDYLKPALDIPYCHHEKWDGTGYPRGLEGEEIPIAARIFAVADVWDALTSDRPYRKAWTKEKAIDYIKEESGKHFDPQVVDVFLSVIR